MKSKQLEELQQNDEIDLLELFASLGQQWKWLVGITLAGVLFSAAVALMLPKIYEVAAQVIMPSTLDAKLITNRGYTKYDSSQLFNNFLAVLNAPDAFNSFVRQGGWLEKFNPEDAKELTEAFRLQKLRKKLVVKVIEPTLVRGAKASTADIVEVSMDGKDEVQLVNFINQYIEYVGNRLLQNIKRNGHGLVRTEINKINHEITLLRSNYTRVTEGRVLMLKEALVLAEKVGVKKPDSVRLYSQNEDQGLAGLTAKSSLFLMGSDYLKGEIEALSSRTSSDSFVPEIFELKIQLEKLGALTFDFSTIAPYQYTQAAVADGKAEKPRRALIVVVCTILAFFITVFVVLIVGAVKRRREIVLES